VKLPFPGLSIGADGVGVGLPVGSVVVEEEIGPSPGV
jgi:hypothetical protein